MISEALYTVEYDNGALIEVRLYTPAPEGFPIGDRIQLTLQPAGGKLSGHVMTVEEAEHIRLGLHLALERLEKEAT